MNKNLKIKAGNLLTLLRWLKQLPLPVETTRIRTRFIEESSKALSFMEEIRTELIKRLANKDKNGQLIVSENESGNKEYDFTEENRKLLEDEYAKMLLKEVEIPQEGNKDKLKVIQEILLTTSFEFSGAIATEYDRWMDAFNNYDR